MLCICRHPLEPKGTPIIAATLADIRTGGLEWLVLQASEMSGWGNRIYQHAPHHSRERLA